MTAKRSRLVNTFLTLTGGQNGVWRAVFGNSVFRNCAHTVHADDVRLKERSSDRPTSCRETASAASSDHDRQSCHDDHPQIGEEGQPVGICHIQLDALVIADIVPARYLPQTGNTGCQRLVDRLE